MEQLREQHAVGEEIAEALTQGSLTTGVDEEELEDELAELQQEELDNKMLKTGTVPVGDRVDRLPVAREYDSTPFRETEFADTCHSDETGGRRGRRRGAEEATGRNGDVRATRDLRRNSAFGSKCVCLFVAFGSAYSMSFGCR
jgi:hypothetical protein